MVEPLSVAEQLLQQAGMLDLPGAVLYSGASTLRNGPVYLLGLNSGGAGSETLGDSIKKSRGERNAYRDEEWGPPGRTRPAGQAILQRRVQHLCTMMNLNVRDVPASNLVFTRSTRLNNHLNFKQAVKLCLPVHEIFIESIKPRFLMTYGAMHHFAEAMKVKNLEVRSAEYGKWKAHRGEAEIAGRNVRFGNVPHLSMWPIHKRSVVVEWALSGLSR